MFFDTIRSSSCRLRQILPLKAPDDNQPHDQSQRGDGGIADHHHEADAFFAESSEALQEPENGNTENEYAGEV